MKNEKKIISSNYLESAIVQKEIISRLIKRLSLINISPRKIIDLGAGIGLSTECLLNQYSKSEFYMLDNSLAALKNKIFNNENVFSICGDFKSIPLESNTFDFVFSSSALHWELDINSSFKEIYIDRA